MWAKNSQSSPSDQGKKRRVTMVRYLRDPNILFGAALSILGLYILTEAGKWTVYGNDGPGPGFFPLIYGAIMLVAALVLTVNSVRAHRVKPVRRTASLIDGGSISAFATWA